MGKDSLVCSMHKHQSDEEMQHTPKAKVEMFVTLVSNKKAYKLHKTVISDVLYLIKSCCIIISAVYFLAAPLSCFFTNYNCFSWLP